MKMFGNKKNEVHNEHEYKNEKQSSFQKRINEVEEISPEQFKKIANKTLSEHHHHHSHHSQSTHHHTSTPKKVEEDFSIDENFDVDKFLAEYQNKLSHQK